ncbi:unnamed protein product [Microthlaspi erraticum]|uniref:Retrotransposon gag domain-containing protein n=1 Tax=Microthlaspi erraticum TaxID=1685480 RepID=A0A6D2IS65_9BRAS|nr:unnamed protein product [Microthlaspi erraticum]
MRTRSSRSTEDLVELDFTTGRKRVQRSQRVQEEPEVLVADTMDVPEGNGNPLGNGLGRARQTRPIGQGDAPNRHQQRQGIVPPPVQNHNFEIKLGMINLVRTRCSMDCQLTKLTNGRRACPMAQSPLGMNARRPFLLSFSPPVAQPSLEEISSFIQRNNETFAEAWERYREMLDTASNGNFLNQDVDDGWQLVENIATQMEAMEKSMIAPIGARPTTRSSQMKVEKRC